MVLKCDSCGAGDGEKGKGYVSLQADGYFSCQQCAFEEEMGQWYFNEQMSAVYDMERGRKWTDADYLADYNANVYQDKIIDENGSEQIVEVLRTGIPQPDIILNTGVKNDGDKIAVARAGKI